MKKIILNTLSVGMLLISTFASAADANLDCSVKYRFDRRDEWKVE